MNTVTQKIRFVLNWPTLFLTRSLLGFEYFWSRYLAFGKVKSNTGNLLGIFDLGLCESVGSKEDAAESFVSRAKMGKAGMYFERTQKKKDRYAKNENSYKNMTLEGTIDFQREMRMAE